jgi:hypothetical protein
MTPIPENQKKLLAAVFCLSAVCWLMSVAVHFATFAGDTDLSESCPWVWGLHVEAIAVCMAVAIVFNMNEKADPAGKISRAAAMRKHFSATPLWLKVIAAAGFVYAIINFILFATSGGYMPDFENGQYMLKNRGKIIRIISGQEYHHYRALGIRGFSGHWIAFNGVAVAALFPFFKGLFSRKEA